MKKFIVSILYLIIIFAIFIFSCWYWYFASCSFIKSWLGGSGSVPARCIQIK